MFVTAVTKAISGRCDWGVWAKSFGISRVKAEAIVLCISILQQTDGQKYNVNILIFYTIFQSQDINLAPPLTLNILVDGHRK